MNIFAPNVIFQYASHILKSDLGAEICIEGVEAILDTGQLFGHKGQCWTRAITCKIILSLGKKKLSNIIMLNSRISHLIFVNIR